MLELYTRLPDAGRVCRVHLHLAVADRYPNQYVYEHRIAASRAMLELTDLRPAPTPPMAKAEEQLVAAAEELFYRRGIGSVGVDLIADTAGVTKRTLYQRYGSKELLVAAYLRRRARAWQTRLLDALTQTSPTSSAGEVELVFAVAAEWALDNPRACAFVNAWAELGSSSHQAVPLIRAEKQWMRDLFTRLTGDPNTAAQVHMLYEGAHIAFTTLSDDRAYSIAAAAAEVVPGLVELEVAVPRLRPAEW